MKMPRLFAENCALIAASLLLVPVAARAQSTIDPAQPYAWGANIGWLHARPTVALGVRTTDTACSGSFWSGNVGWIRMGSGTPGDGYRYSNSGATDWGVNVDAEGALRGFAWGGNIGWVHFEAKGNPRINLATGAFSGLAWSPNVGWLHLGDVAFHPVTTMLQITDADADGLSDAWEIAEVGNLAALSQNGDADGDGVSDRDEYLADTDPFDAADRLQVANFLREGAIPMLRLDVATQPTRFYQVQARESLMVGQWEDVPGASFQGSGAVSTFLINPPATPTGFYRVIARPPLAP